MYGEEDSRQQLDTVTTKLETSQKLDADDLKFVLRYVRGGYGELEEYRGEIDDSITAEVGNATYISILQEFENAGVIEELRPDLVDPSVDPEGFEPAVGSSWKSYNSIRVGGNASEGVGRIHPPDKQPTSVFRIQKSIYDYLFCIGWGFYFDAEMIYDYETDYREFLVAVLDCVAEIDDYNLSVTADDSGRQTTIQVTLSVGSRSYEQEFDHGSDWLRFDVLFPVEEALDTETTQTIRYRGGNDGLVLVVPAEHEEFVMRYPSY
jgi:hypothetical protein